MTFPVVASKHLLIFHWPKIVIWTYIAAREARNYSLYFGKPCDQLKIGRYCYGKRGKGIVG